MLGSNIVGDALGYILAHCRRLPFYCSLFHVLGRGFEKDGSRCTCRAHEHATYSSFYRQGASQNIVVAVRTFPYSSSPFTFTLECPVDITVVERAPSSLLVHYLHLY